MNMNVSENRAGKRKFRNVAYTVICNKYFRIFRKDPSKSTLFTKWRLGYNLYSAEKYFDAFKYLSEVCAEVESSERNSFDNEFRAKISNIYLVAARCAFKMFLITHKHYHLEAAYHKYERSIKNLPVDFLTAIRLPNILFEFCRLLECYGSFESALMTYGKILASFQNYKGYFDVMYRSALVGKFVSSRVNDVTKKHDMIKQCLDIIQFLLEAVPPTINEVHILFLYCVTLEASPDPAFRYQVPEAFKALHKLCRSLRPPLLSADQTADHRLWTEDPYLWYNFGVYFLQDNEVLLARDAFALFMKKIPPNDESLTVEIFLTLAKNCANFQNYEEAVAYGDRALLIDGFHKETRSLLSEWSEIRRAELSLQEDSATAILKVWRQRCWQPGYRSRYTKLVVNELEQTVAMPSSKYDISIRNELAYFARDKWRARFLFEDECARRIQRSFRGARMILSMQRAGREKYKQLANQIYAAAMKKPFDPAIRVELRRIAAHRFCPKNHNVVSFAEAMDEQDAAHAIIRKCIGAFRLRKWVKDRITARLYREQLHEILASVRIQKIVRMRLAIFRTRAMKRVLLRRHNAATVIQQYFRKRNNSFRFSVLRVIQREQWKRDRAANLIVVICVGRIKRRRAQRLRIKTENRAAKCIQKMWRNRKARKLKEQEYRRKAFVIQAFFRGNTSRLTTQLAKRVLRGRKQVQGSNYLNHTCLHVDSLDFSYKPYSNFNNNLMIETPDLSKRQDLLYRTPGIRQNSPIFEAALGNNCVICLGKEDFGPDDCMLLCTVLRHPLCKMQRIVFCGVDGRHPTFEFDLIQAIGKSVSLRSVLLIGGNWGPNFIVSLFEVVQKINPRVVEVLVEDMRSCRITPSELLSLACGAGKLVADFFNYSVPGLRVLSFHGVGLADGHLNHLIAGLGVNSSITTVILSNNMIEDSGFCGILKAISANRRSLVSEIDLSWNLISGLDSELLRVIRLYKNPVFGNSLNINLQSNHIRYEIDVGDEFRNDLALVYELDPLCTGKESQKPKRRSHGAKIPGIQHSRSEAAMFPPVNSHAAHLKNVNKSKIKFKSKPLGQRNISNAALSSLSGTAMF